MTTLPSEQPPPAEDQPDTYVRFTGMKTAGDFPQLPKLGDRQRFGVLAECVKEPHRELMADGRHRPVIGMKVIEVEPGEITAAPRDAQLALGDDEEDEL